MESRHGTVIDAESAAALETLRREGFPTLDDINKEVRHCLVMQTRLLPWRDELVSRARSTAWCSVCLGGIEPRF